MRLPSSANQRSCTSLLKRLCTHHSKAGLLAAATIRSLAAIRRRIAVLHSLHSS